MKIVRRLDGNSCLPKWDLDPILTRIFWSRGIRDPRELSYSLSRLQQPLFKDLELATALIAQAIIDNTDILVAGDYDCDGATSTALALRFFKTIEYHHVTYSIPNRNSEGYGLSVPMVEKAHAQGVGLIITVDNGISALEAVAKAQKLGIKVVITDHHLPPQKLPAAEAIVNPQREDCTFKSKNIAGVGVIFYVLTSVCRALEKAGYFAQRDLMVPDMRTFLDLVAVGTVADVVPMDYNNRVMVSYGIDLIRRKNTSQGLKELIRLAKCPLSNFTSSTIGFGLSPRLNAAGRLDDMCHGVDCLLTDEEYDARVKAAFLDGLNGRRRELEKHMLVHAHELITKVRSETLASIVIYSDSFLRGISGVVASRLQEEFLQPVVVFADGSEPGTLIGSARAGGDFHMRESLEFIAESYPNEVLAFGGHKTAAGITIKSEFLGKFRSLLERAALVSQPHGQEKVFVTDGELPPGYIIAPFARTLVFDQPWGKDFAIPEFDGVFMLLKMRVVGAHLRVLLRLADGREIWGMYFYFDQALWPASGPGMVRLVYGLDINSNRDDASISLIVRGMEPWR